MTTLRGKIRELNWENQYLRASVARAETEAMAWKEAFALMATKQRKVNP